MPLTAVQMMGFSWMFALFLACAVAYKPLTKPAGIHWFQFLYFFSSFWGQFGPNATTWLLPGELFPTEARAMSQGLSAAVGKVRLTSHLLVLCHICTYFSASLFYPADLTSYCNRLAVAGAMCRSQCVSFTAFCDGCPLL